MCHLELPTWTTTVTPHSPAHPAFLYQFPAPCASFIHIASGLTVFSLIPRISFSPQSALQVISVHRACVNVSSQTNLPLCFLSQKLPQTLNYSGRFVPWAVCREHFSFILVQPRNAWGFTPISPIQQSLCKTYTAIWIRAVEWNIFQCYIFPWNFFFHIIHKPMYWPKR